MQFNKEYNSFKDIEIYNLILEQISNKVITSKSREVNYEIKVINDYIYFKRLDAQTNNVFERISKQKFISIIRYIRILEKINTTTLKPIIGGKQAPTLAILDYCHIRL